MKTFLHRTLWFALSLGLFVSAVEACPGEDARDTIKKTFKVRPGGTLYLDLDRGNVEIRTGTDDMVHIEIERIVEARNHAEAKRILGDHELDFRQNGDDVRVRSRFDDERWSRKFWGRHAQFKMEVRILVPARFNLDFTSGAGNVRVDDVVGEVAGRTGAGNVVIGKVRGTVEVSSGAGNISVEGAQGTIEVHSGAGNIVVREVGGEIRAHTGAGNITATITTQPDGDSRLESGAGNVTVYLADEIGVDVDAVASVGSANCDSSFGLKIKGRWMKKSFGGRVNGGGPVLVMRSGVGNVSLRER